MLGLFSTLESEEYEKLGKITLYGFDNTHIDDFIILQSGASSRSKIGGAYFSDVTGSIQDPIAVPGPCEVT